jgi:hypothetical protein
MKLILGSLSLLLLIAAVIVGLSSASTTVTQTVTGSGVSCSSSCVNGVCKNTCSDGGDVKIGNGDIVDKVLDIQGFSEITINSVDVTASHGSEYTVSLRADSNLIDDLKVKKQGASLNIARENGAYQNETMEVRITTPHLNKFSNFGAQTATVAGFNHAKLWLNNEGTGVIKLQDSRLAALRYDGHGSTTLLSSNSEVDTADLSVSGASEVNLSFSAEAGKLKGLVEGVSSVYYCGNPSVDIDRSGIVDIVQRCN